MKAFACVRLSVNAEGQLLVEPDAHLEVHSDSASGDLFVKAGTGRIRVVKTAGLHVPQTGARFNRFVPMFDHHGVLQGLAIGESSKKCNSGRRSLLVLVGVGEAGSRHSSIHSTHLFCGSRIYGDGGRIEAYITVLDHAHQLTIDTGRALHRFCNREGSLVRE